MFTASMTFDLGGDVNPLRDMVHAWAQAHLTPMAAQIDRDTLFPPALWMYMGALALLCLPWYEYYRR